MPEVHYLQIETRESQGSRVIMLEQNSIRVGRGLHCEVSLSDASLADVECVLRLRGETWYVQPLGARSRVSIGGKSIHHLRILPTGVTLHVGTDRLTVRSSPETEPEFGTFHEPIPIGPNEEPEFITESEDEQNRRDFVRGWNREPSRFHAREAPSASTPTCSDAWNRQALPPLWQSDQVFDETPVAASPIDDQDDGWEPVDIPPETLSTFESVVAAPGCEDALLSSMTEAVPFVPGHVTPSDSEISAAIPETEMPLVSGLFNPPDLIPATIQALPNPCSSPRASGSTEPDPAEQNAPSDGLPDLDDLEWPSARVILAATRMRAPSSASAAKPTRRSPRPMPTEARGPRQWSIPAKWAVAPVSVVILACTCASSLCWIWGNDSYEAGTIVDRLLRSPEGRDNGAASAVASMDASWWRTTAEHLAIKAAALGTSSSGDPDQREPIPFLLNAARQASPLERSSRLARIQHGSTDSNPLDTLGMSRDPVNLTLTARRLAQAGKKDASLNAYRAALELAAKAPIDPSQPPVFLGEKTPGRFALPNEEMIVRIVRDLASQPDWSAEQWADVLPADPLVLLATYRVLQERESPQTEAVLDRLVADPGSAFASHPEVGQAARAEGLALRDRRPESIDLYREAISATGLEPVRRTWWFNLAEILARSGQRDTMNDALEAARAGRGDDTIGRMVGQAIAREGLVAPAEDRTMRLRAN